MCFLPNLYVQLCVYDLFKLHFEDSQFELKRADGRKLLKWNAIPTKFDVPNLPKPISSKRKCPKERIVNKADINEGEIFVNVFEFLCTVPMFTTDYIYYHTENLVVYIEEQKMCGHLPVLKCCL